MSKREQLSISIKIAACVCAKDGVISEQEEAELFRLVNEHYPDFGDDQIDQALTDYLSSDAQVLTS